MRRTVRSNQKTCKPQTVDVVLLEQMDAEVTVIDDRIVVLV